MLKFISILQTDQACSGDLTLSFDQRVKSRQRVILDNGEEAGVFLPRGSVLKNGDKIRAESGEIVQVKAAIESVSTVYLKDPIQLARTCYHLGNRHVPLQIDTAFIRYQHDHVLDHMVRGLGLEVCAEQALFEPEAGAYGGHSSSHSHDHGHHHD